VPAGGQATATIAVTVAPGTPPGTTILNTAVVSTSTPPGPTGPALPATATVVTVAPAATVPGGAPPPAGLPITGTQLLVPLGTGLVLLLLGLAFVARSARTRRKV